MSRFRLLFPVFFLLCVAFHTPVHAQTEAPAAANKRLFDRTVDELNFRTMETVYDKSFTRNKFPVSLRTHQARRQFDGFGTNASLKKLFQNYNDASERFKSRFGKGRTDLAEFEKQLRSILLDKNFEFFIHNLPRDERVALIRAEERIIKQATAQFNASEDPAPEDVAADGAAVPPADAGAEPPVTAPIEDPAPRPEAQVTETTTTTTPALRAADAPAAHDWLDYLTLLLAATATLLLAHIVLNVLPDLRARLDGLAEELEEQRPDLDRPARRSTSALPEDRYEDEQ
ncbi:hypothetical protein SAMN02745146_1739 [Hymenobacter daecheongensis DSM 21074]|uniref:Uncharacterized protein n=1 Tax=Hymenobacter daecheongensis DSM 21074 TaxID=1121955 RepID=A0A1M6ELX6_9BACT|nr:hypothetical protein [Hymenobacter daecheongensis]SHI86522.1 hypothetical protein SAMN02745146_1739 [Hymenobacter daecheongensis DSM 21074]